MGWYQKVLRAGQAGDMDLVEAIAACDAFEVYHGEARREMIFVGRIESLSSRIAGMAEHRYSQLQELESILEYIEQREMRERVNKTKHFMEHYQRTLSERVATQYAEASQEVQDIRTVLHQVAYWRNQFLGVMKGLEYLHFQLSNLTKLRTAGMEDAQMDTRPQN